MILFVLKYTIGTLVFAGLGYYMLSNLKGKVKG
jgi:hypothetical protein